MRRALITGVVREIPLTKGFVAIVSDEDYENVTRFRWHALCGKWGVYAIRKTNNKTEYLHRFLMNAPSSMSVDHIDGDRLNCQRSNLRICTPQENQWAFRRKQQNRVTSSSFMGVSWCKRDKCWRAHIAINRKSRSLGTFSTEEQAARAYDTAARERDGEFTRRNFRSEEICP